MTLRDQVLLKNLDHASSTSKKTWLSFPFLATSGVVSEHLGQIQNVSMARIPKGVGSLFLVAQIRFHGSSAFCWKIHFTAVARKRLPTPSMLPSSFLGPSPRTKGRFKSQPFSSCFDPVFSSKRATTCNRFLNRGDFCFGLADIDDRYPVFGNGDWPLIECHLSWRIEILT